MKTKKKVPYNKHQKGLEEFIFFVEDDVMVREEKDKKERARYSPPKITTKTKGD